MATPPLTTHEVESLRARLEAIRRELLDAADQEVHVGYAAAYRGLARQCTKVIERLDQMAKVVAARELADELA